MKLLGCSIIVLIFFCIVGCGSGDDRRAPSTTAPATGPANNVELENRGVGLMGRYDFAGAIDVFEQLDSPEGRLNLAIATLNRQQEGDSAAALAILQDVL